LKFSENNYQKKNKRFYRQRINLSNWQKLTNINQINYETETTNFIKSRIPWNMMSNQSSRKRKKSNSLANDSMKWLSMQTVKNLIRKKKSKAMINSRRNCLFWNRNRVRISLNWSKKKNSYPIACSKWKQKHQDLNYSLTTLSLITTKDLMNSKLKSIRRTIESKNSRMQLPRKLDK